MNHKVAVIGCGNMGSKHAKALNKLGILHEVMDPISNRVISLAKQYDVLGLDTKANITSDTVVIATPINSHYVLAKKYIEQGKHVLVEKPFTMSADSARHLQVLAKKHKVHVACDFIERYNIAFIDIAKELKKDEQPNAYFTRYSSMFDKDGLPKPELTSVYEHPLWDLACHDLDLACRLFGHATVRQVRTVNCPPIQHGVSIYLEHANGTQSNIMTMCHPGQDNRTMSIETIPPLCADFITKTSNAKHQTCRPTMDQLERMWTDFLTKTESPHIQAELNQAIHNVELLEEITDKTYCDTCMEKPSYGEKNDCSC